MTDYGLTDSGLPGLIAAVQRARAGIDTATINDQTHAADAYLHWGAASWLNDLYLGLHGGLYIADLSQVEVYARELRKIASHVGAVDQAPLVPYNVSADGASATFNPDAGMDLDRCAQFVIMAARVYQVTGDLQFARDLYPDCVRVIEFLRARDLDGDGLPEGRTDSFTDPPGRGVGACSSLTYIGDTAANTWKDFGAAMFLHEALTHLATLERALDSAEIAAARDQEADVLKRRIRQVFWDADLGGFVAWFDVDMAPHRTWITGNNTHAVACGLTSQAQSAAILRSLNAASDQIEGVVPCRTCIDTFPAGECSDPENYYWNGGSWVLVAAPVIRARASVNDLNGAMRIIDTLANRTAVSDVGFYESYWADTGKPNDCAGLLMNNGGFLWGLHAGLFGIGYHESDLLIRASVPAAALPAEARIQHHGNTVNIQWTAADNAQVQLDGKNVTLTEGVARISISPGQDSQHQLMISATGG